MPFNGGMSPSPERYGGGVPVLRRITEAVGANRGTAYNTSDIMSTVYAENFAIAKCINAAREANLRLGNQWDSARMTDFIPRWERILGLTPTQTDTEQDRRLRIASKFQQWGQAGFFPLLTILCTQAIGSHFIGFTFQTPLAANFGTNPWFSTIAHVLVHVKRIPNETEQQFLQAMVALYPILDQYLPCWVTWDWYLSPTGTTGEGFILAGTQSDSYEVNIGHEVFDA